MLKARILLFALLISITPVLAADGDDGGHRKWVASWATSPATFFAYAPPPQPFVLVPGQTIRPATANIQPDLVFPFPNATSRPSGPPPRTSSRTWSFHFPTPPAPPAPAPSTRRSARW